MAVRPTLPLGRLASEGPIDAQDYSSQHDERHEHGAAERSQLAEARDCEIQESARKSGWQSIDCHPLNLLCPSWALSSLFVGSWLSCCHLEADSLRTIRSGSARSQRQIGDAPAPARWYRSIHLSALPETCGACAAQRDLAVLQKEDGTRDAFRGLPVFCFCAHWHHLPCSARFFVRATVDVMKYNRNNN